MYNRRYHYAHQEDTSCKPVLYAQLQKIFSQLSCFHYFICRLNYSFHGYFSKN